MTDLPLLHISAGNQRSDILVRAGLLDEVGLQLRSRSKAVKACVLTDDTVGPLYLNRLRASLATAGFDAIVHTQPAGETHKYLDALLPAYGTFLSANIDRATPLIALGGGVVGDMAGFVAATLLRGLPFVQVPTTLMAMVDSSIGGKTGVNHKVGKNLIGAFHQPIVVLADPGLLHTLPQDEFTNGLAECIKHDLIRNAYYFAGWRDVLPGILARNIGVLTGLVHHNAAIKAGVVNEDPFENGVRAHLNLGHTFAHAIESVTHHAVPHGRAVALGLTAAAALSANLGLLTHEAAGRVEATLAAAGLPTRHPGLDAGALIEAMSRDKKVVNGRLRFVLLETIGKATVRNDIDPRAVRKALRTLED